MMDQDPTRDSCDTTIGRCHFQLPPMGLDDFESRRATHRVIFLELLVGILPYKIPFCQSSSFIHRFYEAF
jgi:hypothetical protein